MNADRTIEADWFPGRIPENVLVEEGAYLETSYSFTLFQSRVPEAVRIGAGSSLYLGVMLDLREKARVKIGRQSLIHGARLICDEEITIGDYCLISWNVVLMDTYRLPINPAARRQMLLGAQGCAVPHGADPGTVRPIHIGANVWIGFDSCVLPGVTISEGSVVGARSVVHHDVPPFTVVAGNPARAVRTLEPFQTPSAPAIPTALESTNRKLA